MPTTDREIVAALEQAIVQRIGEPRYQLWFANHTHFRWDDHALMVGVPNLHFQEWLESKFGPEVAAAAAEVFGHRVLVRFTIDPALFQAAQGRSDLAGVKFAIGQEPNPAAVR